MLHKLVEQPQLQFCQDHDLMLIFHLVEVLKGRAVLILDADGLAINDPQQRVNAATA